MARYKIKLTPRKAKKTFPVWLIITGFGLILAAAWALISSGGQEKTVLEVTGAPAIRVDQESYDYGDVKLGGTPIRTAVKVTNVGDQTLKFTEAPYVEVLEGCWPPTPAVGSTALKPGETTTISMEFFMHGEMGGLHNFALHLLTNDPDNPDKIVSIISNWED